MLKFDTAAPQGSAPPFTAALTQYLDWPVMTANLYDGQAGKYGFGSIDHLEFTGAIQWNPANNSQSAWTIDKIYFSINGQQTSLSAGLGAVLGIIALHLFHLLAHVVSEQRQANVPQIQTAS